MGAPRDLRDGIMDKSRCPAAVCAPTGVVEYIRPGTSCQFRLSTVTFQDPKPISLSTGPLQRCAPRTEKKAICVKRTGRGETRRLSAGGNRASSQRSTASAVIHVLTTYYKDWPLRQATIRSRSPATGTRPITANSSTVDWMDLGRSSSGSRRTVAPLSRREYYCSTAEPPVAPWDARALQGLNQAFGL